MYTTKTVDPNVYPFWIFNYYFYLHITMSDQIHLIDLFSGFQHFQAFFKRPLCSDKQSIVKMSINVKYSETVINDENFITIFLFSRNSVASSTNDMQFFVKICRIGNIVKRLP